MNNSYLETNVAKKVTTKDNVIKVAAWGIVVLIAIAGALLAQPILFIVALAAAMAAYSLLPRLSIVYEYVFCDGQIDFDKIMAGEKRKHLYRTDLDKAVIVAPANSHELDGYRNQNMAKKDFTSLEENRKVYALVENAGELHTMIFFEPNEKLLAMIKQKAPRKLKEY